MPPDGGIEHRICVTILQRGRDGTGSPPAVPASAAVLPSSPVSPRPPVMAGLLRLVLTLIAPLGCAAAGAGAVPTAQRTGDQPEAGLFLDVVVGAQKDLALYRLDPRTGSLRERTRLPMGVRTAYLAASADGRHVYAGNGAAPGHVIALTLDRRAGTFTRLNSASSAGAEDAPGNSHVFLHPSGRWLLTAHRASGRLSVMPIATDGRIGPPSDTRVLTEGVHQVMTDRAGKHALVPVRDAQMVAQFVIDADAGRWIPNDPPSVPSAPASGPRHLALTPDERFAYVNNETNGTVTAYRYAADSGRLTAMDTVSSVPAGFSETGSAHLLVHPSGKFLYVSNRFHGSLAAFAIDKGSGRLTLLQVETANGNIKFPRNFDLTPSGDRLVVGNERGDSLLVLKVDGTTGLLSPMGPPVPAPTGPQVVVILR
jgi:6-phosphogluconolactonase